MADQNKPPAPPAPAPKPVDEAALRAQIEGEMRAKFEQEQAAAAARHQDDRAQIEAEVRAKIEAEADAKARATLQAEKDRRATVRTMTVEILRDVWPRDQTVDNPNPLTTNEVRHRVGDIVDLPEDEAIDLIELGAVKQYRGRR